MYIINRMAVYFHLNIHHIPGLGLSFTHEGLGNKVLGRATAFPEPLPVLPTTILAAEVGGWAL